MRRHELRLRALEVDARSETPKELRHAVLAIARHGGRHVMRARHDVRDNLRLGRVGHRGLEHADDRRLARAEPDALSEHRWIRAQLVGPEPVGHHDGARRGRAIVLWPDETPEDGPEAHDLEIAAVHQPGRQLARLAKAHRRERHRRELADRSNGLQAAAEVGNLRHREIGVLGADASGRLPEIDQPALVAVRQRLQQNAADDAEDRGIRADAESQGEDDSNGEAGSANEPPGGVSKLAQKRHAGFLQGSIPRWPRRL